MIRIIDARAVREMGRVRAEAVESAGRSKLEKRTGGKMRSRRDQKKGGSQHGVVR
jgi:hypothetical protein